MRRSSPRTPFSCTAKIARPGSSKRWTNWPSTAKETTVALSSSSTTSKGRTACFCSNTSTACIERSRIRSPWAPRSCASAPIASPSRTLLVSCRFLSRAFPATFGLTELRRGFFPHLFNTLENQDYEGPMPDAHFYDPDGMSGKKKAEFDWWYAEQVCDDVVFYLQRDMASYCESDVKLLKAGCQTFQEECEERWNSTPLSSVSPSPPPATVSGRKIPLPIRNDLLIHNDTKVFSSFPSHNPQNHVNSWPQLFKGRITLFGR